MCVHFFKIFSCICCFCLKCCCEKLILKFTSLPHIYTITHTNATHACNTTKHRNSYQLNEIGYKSDTIRLRQKQDVPKNGNSLEEGRRDSKTHTLQHDMQKDRIIY